MVDSLILEKKAKSGAVDYEDIVAQNDVAIKS